jgi:hypothetical protein
MLQSIRNRTADARRNLTLPTTAMVAMNDGAEKLRALAKQSRTLSRCASSKERAKMLLALADLYDHQARQLDSQAA